VSEDPFLSTGRSGRLLPVEEPAPTGSGAPEGPWSGALRRALSHPKVQIAVVLLLAVVLGSMAAPVWSPILVGVGPTDQNLVAGPQPPLSRSGSALTSTDARTTFHWLGTDELGRDLLVRVAYGGRVSLVVGGTGALISLALGIAVGILAGYLRRGRLLLRALAAVRGLPLLLFALGLLLVTGFEPVWLCLALGGVLWPRVALEVGARIRRVRASNFVEAARFSGAGQLWILRHHVLPHVAPVAVVSAAYTLPMMMLAESLLSFAGLGIRAPLTSWGSLTAEGSQTMDLFPWLMLFPGLALALTVIALRWLAEGLRSALGDMAEARSL
jgi:oligopeptide transport system permease protein